MSVPHVPFFRRRAVAAACLLPVLCTLPATGRAQQAAAPPDAAASSAPQRITVTGNPLGTPQAASPVTLLAGDALSLRRAGTLGETLDGLPGVSNTGFGPNSGRPVIRGLDGDRIRLLDNGAAAVDASALSFDHAVAVDPLVAERIEVLRGPAALLYGGNATGGVINSVDNRVPRGPVDGLSGRAELRLGGAAAERAGVVVLDGGMRGGGLTWHADGFTRRTDDLRTPRYTPTADGEPLAPARRVRNSASQSEGGALGAGWTDARGFLGVSLDSYRNDYGVTVEPDVLIRMRRERLLLAGERRGLAGPLRSVSGHVSQTDYRHQEVEGSGEVGTTFDSRGRELRLQAEHAPVGAVRGVFGLQAEDLTFSALGEEAFVPDTRTRGTALYLLEEWVGPGVTLSAGVRGERVRVSSSGDAPDAPQPRFGAPLSRSFSPTTVSLGARWPATRGWAYSVSAGRTERAPAYYELYANGLHLATAAFERGDPTLGVERSTHLALGTEWTDGPHGVKASVHASRFDRFIALDATGALITVDGEEGPVEVPEYRFTPVPARLHGLELEGHTGLRAGAWDLTLRGGLDFTRATNRRSGEPLARIAPMRVTAGLDAVQGDWAVGADLVHAARQDRVPSTDTPTDGYTLLNLSVRWTQRAAGADWLWFARVSNVTDAVATNAVAIQTVRGLSPLGGRALSVGVRTAF
jgi:iron complex outermembrane recepter protein